MGGHFHDVLVGRVLRPEKGAEALIRLGGDFLSGNLPIVEPETVIAVFSGPATGAGLALGVDGAGEETDVADEGVAFHLGGELAHDVVGSEAGFGGQGDRCLSSLAIDFDLEANVVEQVGFQRFRGDIAINE